MNDDENTRFGNDYPQQGQATPPAYKEPQEEIVEKEVVSTFHYPEGYQERQPQDYETESEEAEREGRGHKASFSFGWGIGLCASSILILILAIAVGAALRGTGDSAALWFFTIVAVAGLVLSIIGLVKGIKGIRSDKRTKAIIGTAFNGQNIIVYIYLIIICAALAEAASYHYNPYFYY